MGGESRGMTGHSLGRREPSFRERAGIGDSGRCRALRCEGASPAASDRTSLRGSGWALGGRGRGLPSEPEGEVQVVPAYEELEALPEWLAKKPPSGQGNSVTWNAATMLSGRRQQQYGRAD